MLFVNDAKGEAIYTGPEWVSLTGVDLAKSLGLEWLEMVHRDDRALVEDTHCKAVEIAIEYSIRYRLLGPHGSVRWVDVGARPSFGPPESTFLGFLGSLTVLTDAATTAIKAYGNVGSYVSSSVRPRDNLDRITDHMILATTLIEAEQLVSAMPGVRYALYELGRALAHRREQRRRPN